MKSRCRCSDAEAAGYDLAHTDVAGRHIGDGVDPGGIGDGAWLAGVELAVVVQVDEDDLARDAFLAGVLLAVAVDVIEERTGDSAHRGAGDGGGGGSRRWAAGQ